MVDYVQGKNGVSTPKSTSKVISQGGSVGNTSFKSNTGLGSPKAPTGFLAPPPTKYPSPQKSGVISQGGTVGSTTLVGKNGTSTTINTGSSGNITHAGGSSSSKTRVINQGGVVSGTSLPIRPPEPLTPPKNPFTSSNPLVQQQIAQQKNQANLQNQDLPPTNPSATLGLLQRNQAGMTAAENKRIDENRARLQEQLSTLKTNADTAEQKYTDFITLFPKNDAGQRVIRDQGLYEISEKLRANAELARSRQDTEETQLIDEFNFQVQAVNKNRAAMTQAKDILGNQIIDIFEAKKNTPPPKDTSFTGYLKEKANRTIKDTVELPFRVEEGITQVGEFLQKKPNAFQTTLRTAQVASSTQKATDDYKELLDLFPKNKEGSAIIPSQNVQDRLYPYMEKVVGGKIRTEQEQSKKGIIQEPFDLLVDKTAQKYGLENVNREVLGELGNRAVTTTSLITNPTQFLDRTINKKSQTNKVTKDIFSSAAGRVYDNPGTELAIFATSAGIGYGLSSLGVAADVAAVNTPWIGTATNVINKGLTYGIPALVGGKIGLDIYENPQNSGKIVGENLVDIGAGITGGLFGKEVFLANQPRPQLVQFDQGVSESRIKNLDNGQAYTKTSTSSGVVKQGDRYYRVETRKTPSGLSNGEAGFDTSSNAYDVVRINPKTAEPITTDPVTGKALPKMSASTKGNTVFRVEDDKLFGIGTEKGSFSVGNKEYPVSNTQVLQLQPGPSEGQFTTLGYRVDNAGRLADQGGIGLYTPKGDGFAVETSYGVSGESGKEYFGTIAKNLASGDKIESMSIRVRGGPRAAMEVGNVNDALTTGEKIAFIGLQENPSPPSKILSGLGKKGQLSMPSSDSLVPNSESVFDPSDVGVSPSGVNSVGGSNVRSGISSSKVSSNDASSVLSGLDQYGREFTFGPSDLGGGLLGSRVGSPSSVRSDFFPVSRVEAKTSFVNLESVRSSTSLVSERAVLGTQPVVFPTVRPESRVSASSRTVVETVVIPAVATEVASVSANDMVASPSAGFVGLSLSGFSTDIPFVPGFPSDSSGGGSGRQKDFFSRKYSKGRYSPSLLGIELFKEGRRGLRNEPGLTAGFGLRLPVGGRVRSKKSRRRLSFFEELAL